MIKKNIAIIFGVFFCVGLSSTAFAAAVTQSGGTLTITTPTATCPGPDLVYTPSPSSLMSACSSSTAYTITAASSKTDTNNGMEYGIRSINEGYFQRKQVEANKVEATTSDTTLPGDNWLDKNGNSPEAVEDEEEEAAGGED